MQKEQRNGGPSGQEAKKGNEGQEVKDVKESQGAGERRPGLGPDRGAGASAEQTLALLRELISRRSVTPQDAGCQDVVEAYLRPFGFARERFDRGETTNSWLRRGNGRPLFVFAGHTDVVPPGDESAWASPPFEPTVEGDVLRGRGAQDMKSGLACFCVAAARFAQTHPKAPGSVAWLLTSDEEGDGIDGTAPTVRALIDRGERADWCLVGEPTCGQTPGDVVKNGRRGSLLGSAKIIGKQGHVAYPHLANNPIHRGMAPLAKLCATVFDEGDANFPPTSFQITEIKAGTGASNVIPAAMEARFNFRFGAAQSEDGLKKAVEDAFQNCGAKVEFSWRLSGKPFVTAPGRLTEAALSAIERSMGAKAKLDTGGGTSDGRFVKDMADELIELGTRNDRIHQIDEQVSIAELGALSDAYFNLLEILFMGSR